MRCMRRVTPVPGVFIQPAHVTAKAIGGRRSSACRVLPFRLSGQTVAHHTFLGIEPPQELLHILPGDLLDGEIALASPGAGIIPHHRFPLSLYHFIFAQIKRSTDTDCAYGLLVRIAVEGSHRECTGRDQYELHPEAIGEPWSEPYVLLLDGADQAIQDDGYEHQRAGNHASNTRGHDMLG